ncbi:TraR/DksA family transcriptional regulator [Granulosicoccaceae sp. 1_MG-2023]|nr:TraR/DksA family transcriptional regulator [Granulosicoccaceae sp. 1_MG-2023]
MSLSAMDIEQKLLARKAELTQRLHRIETDLENRRSADFSEQATERENDEVLDGIGQTGEIELQRINRALIKLQEGSYGICEVCGEPIEPARLEVIPDAVRCVKCAG